jgi:ABC-type nickel/cobalt efflux system permease component RcnA
MGRHGRSLLLRVLAAPLAVALAVVSPANAIAHPLGNFTINHYAEVRIEPDRVLLDIVIDQAEIPTFQARLDFDLDGDATLSDEEIDAGRVTACDALAPSLSLTAGGMPVALHLAKAGLSFPLGVGGLATMRQVCTFEAPLVDEVASDGIDVGFTDSSFPGRAGWREIVATGSATTLTAVTGDLRATGLSDRLLSYPEDRIASPLADASLVVHAAPGGATLPELDVPDAQPVGAPSAAPSIGPSPAPSAPIEDPVAPAPAATPVSVPGGVSAAELPEIFRQADLTPVVLLLSLAAAAALGAGHALTPGHGKTLMAAYLVGTRGSPRHALGLGAAVSLSHTVGILILATVVVAATDVVAPDVIVRWAPVVAAVSIVLIGGWMLVGEVRRRRAIAHGTAHAHGHGHDHPHGHAHDHGHRHDHDHGHGHAPATAITWRSLFLLGLAGGLIPSTSALLILLGSIAAGRPAFGLVLVVAFGLGMAAVMSGIGLLLVTARDRVDRVQAGAGLARIRDGVPLAASVVVLGFGIVLTAQALAAVRVA